MYRLTKDKKGIILLTVILFFILMGCTKEAGQDRIIATVNNQPIFSKDLQRQIALKIKVDPAFKITPKTLEDELNALIERRLLIQEAMQRGLAREERFVNTIKSFWEQTLIRDLIDYKKHQFQDYIYASDDEIKVYYEKLKFRVKFGIIESKDKAKLENLLKKSSKEPIGCDRVIGPVAYEDIQPALLRDAVGLNLGQVRIFSDRPRGAYYLVQMLEKEPVDIAPLKDIYDEVKSRLKEYKYALAFEKWLTDVRQRARVRTDMPLVIREIK